MSIESTDPLPLPPIPKKELERLVARAHELQEADEQRKAETITGEDLREIASGVGLKEEYLRRALAEIEPKSVVRHSSSASTEPEEWNELDLSVDFGEVSAPEGEAEAKEPASIELGGFSALVIVALAGLMALGAFGVLSPLIAFMLAAAAAVLLAGPLLAFGLAMVAGTMSIFVAFLMIVATLLIGAATLALPFALLVGALSLLF